jgi:uncharacterized protein YqgC (DUF456 family)
MSTLVLLSILLGALLGMRFKVFVLIPAIAFALIVILAYGTAFRIGLSGIFLAIAVASSCLQIGYMFSLLARYGATLAREGRPGDAPTVR